jgi:lysozyme
VIVAFVTSPNGRKFIEDWEGLFLKTYDDGTGTLTIGYGHTSAAGPPVVVPGMVITEEQADAILAADLASVEAEVNRLVTAEINQNQGDALVSFDFNTGGLGRSSLLNAVNEGKSPATVQADFGLWVMGGGRVMQGLVRRRAAEYVLYSTGQIVGP